MANSSSRILSRRGSILIMESDQNQYTENYKNSKIISADFNEKKHIDWKNRNRITRVIVISIVLVILAIIFFVIWKFQSNKNAKIKSDQQTKSSASRIIKNRDALGEDSKTEFIKDATQTNSYSSGKIVDLSKIKSFETAYALSLSFVDNNDLENALAAFALAETKLDNINKYDVYTFYLAYSSTLAYANSNQLAIEKLIKAKEMFIQSDLAKEDALFRDQTIQRIDEKIAKLK